MEILSIKHKEIYNYLGTKYNFCITERMELVIDKPIPEKEKQTCYCLNFLPFHALNIWCKVITHSTNCMTIENSEASFIVVFLLLCGYTYFELLTSFSCIRILTRKLL